MSEPLGLFRGLCPAAFFLHPGGENRVGYSNTGSQDNGTGGEATDDPTHTAPSDSPAKQGATTPAPPQQATAIESENQAEFSAPRVSSAEPPPPPADNQKQQQRDSDSEIRSEASEDIPATNYERRGLQDNEQRHVEGGAEGRHNSGAMDESHYHFSEDAVSVSAESIVGPGTGHAPVSFQGGGPGSDHGEENDDGSAAAAAEMKNAAQENPAGDREKVVGAGGHQEDELGRLGEGVGVVDGRLVGDRGEETDADRAAADRISRELGNSSFEVEGGGSDGGGAGGDEQEASR